MNLLLHIGTEKTGSSTIQAFLHQNRQVLAEQGFHVVESLDGTNCRALAAYAMNRDRSDAYHLGRNVLSAEQRIEFEQEIQQAVTRELESLPASIHTLVISAEHLHSRIHRPEEVERVLGLFQPTVSSVRVLCYLRPQIEMAVSLYSTALRNGETRQLELWLEKTVNKRHYFLFNHVLGLWSGVIGKENMNVRFLHRSELVEGDLLKDFVAHAGLPERDYKIPRRYNESISPSGQKILLTVNRVMRFKPGEGFSKPRRDFLSFINRYFSGSGRKPSPDSAAELQAQFSEPNLRLKKNWFPDREFPPNWML